MKIERQKKKKKKKRERIIYSFYFGKEKVFTFVWKLYTRIYEKSERFDCTHILYEEGSKSEVKEIL